MQQMQLRTLGPRQVAVRGIAGRLRFGNNGQSRIEEHFCKSNDHDHDPQARVVGLSPWILGTSRHRYSAHDDVSVAESCWGVRTAV